MPVDLVIANAKIQMLGQVTRAGLAIDGGRIVEIAKEANLPIASRKLNLKGLLVLPGLIDAHVHLRDQKLDYKEDFFTGTAAAACGGVTLVIDMPNNKPVTMSQSTLRERMSIAAQKSMVNVAFHSAFPQKTNEMKGIVQEGAKAFKFFMHEKIGGIDPTDDETLVEAFRETVQLGVPVAVHAEDGTLIEDALNNIKETGSDSLGEYFRVHSPEAEVKAVNRILEVTRKSKARTHICHISTGRGIHIVSAAKLAGLLVTCEVTPHHLLIPFSHLKEFGPVALTNPPLRSDEDIRSLWAALQEGNIDILVSDHAPHTWEEKRKSSIWDVTPGIPGLETLLPLMMTQVNEGRLPLATLVKMISLRPAEIFGIKGRGDIRKGNYADLVVVDPKQEWRIDSSQFRSKAKFSPFDGWHVKGKPVKTFVNGRLVMDEGEIVGKPGDGLVIR